MHNSPHVRAWINKEALDADRKTAQLEKRSVFPRPTEKKSASMKFEKTSDGKNWTAVCTALIPAKTLLYRGDPILVMRPAVGKEADESRFHLSNALVVFASRKNEFLRWLSSSSCSLYPRSEYHVTSNLPLQQHLDLVMKMYEQSLEVSATEKAKLGASETERLKSVQVRRVCIERNHSRCPRRQPESLWRT